MQIKNRLVPSYWLVNWFLLQSLQPKGHEFESTCVLFFYLYSNRLISFIIDVPRSLRNEILDHSISKG